MDFETVVAIVGRPNVGKSSLMNRIVGYRHAIVDPTPGVTRDRNYAVASWNGRNFAVVDTGGLDPDDKKSVQAAIRAQVEFAINESDAIVLLCDSRDGLLSHDREILDLLRKSAGEKPLFLAVNKLDNPQDESSLWEFHKLGFDPIFPISAVHGHGVADLLDAVVAGFPVTVPEEAEKDSTSRITIVGKPNVGKSSLFNRLLGEDRSIVDDVPGTTRDTIIVTVEKGGRKYRFVDTAGLRRPARNKESVEQFSVFRTLEAIRRTDIAILLLDSSEGMIAEQDKRIAARIIESGSGCIVVWNKWDVRHGIRKGEEGGSADQSRIWKNAFQLTRREFPLLDFAPVISVSAKTGLRLDKIFDAIDKVKEAGSVKIPPERLKTMLFEATTIQPPPSVGGRPLRLSNLVQLHGPPIIFRLKCNQPQQLHFSYQRYILNLIRQEATFEGWPVKLQVSS